MKKSMALLLFLITGASWSAAQTVPAMINYQGQLLDSTGAPLPTADYVPEFNIYDDANGGSNVWGPQIFDGQVMTGHGPKIPVVQGYFNVILGPEDEDSDSLADAFGGSNRYIEITVTNNPVPISPRQQILSAPYALNADVNHLRAADGDPAQAVFVDDDGKVGIGTTSPVKFFHVENPGTNMLFDQIALFNRPSLSTSNDQTLIIVGRSHAAYEGGMFGFRWNSDPAKRVAFFGVTGVEALSVNKDGNVGIGTTDPVFALTVEGEVLVNKVGVPSSFHRLDTVGDDPRFLMDSLGTTKVMLRTAGDSYFIGGNVGIGNTTPSENLHVSGNVLANNISVPSDQRFKKNIHVIQDALDKILQIDGVEFEWKTDEFEDMNFEKETQLGVIAQEVEAVIPEAVSTLKDGYKTLRYDDLVAVLLQAVKEQQAQIETLTDKVEALEVR